MTERGTYWTHDASLMVGVEPTEKRKNGDWQCDWQGHACLLRVLKRLGFTIGNDPSVRYPYMVRKSFERAVIALKADLAGRGFVLHPPLVCSGCGSEMTDAELAAERAKNPKLRSCCPERKMVSRD
jgi:hypothetical protein